MKDYLSGKVNHYRNFADAVQKKFMQLRFGVKSCAAGFDLELSTIRKELADWQENNDCGLESAFNVNAGNNQNITLPQSTLILTATIEPSDTTLSSILWTQVSGPNTAIIVTADSLTTTVAGLIEGLYTFKITVETSTGIIGSDIVTNSVLYINPRADAGPDKSFVYPNNTGTLTGTDIPGSYPIASVVWTKTSGPTLGTISANGNYTNLIVGNYTFRKTVTDINGKTGFDEMNLSMIAASAVVNYGWSSTDPYLSLIAGTPFTFQKSMSISNNEDLVLDFHDMPPFSYPVIEVPASYEIKNHYSDSGSVFNQDFIPGDHFRSTFVVSGKRYYTSYGTESFSSGINDKVTFSKL